MRENSGAVSDESSQFWEPFCEYTMGLARKLLDWVGEPVEDISIHASAQEEFLHKDTEESHKIFKSSGGRIIREEGEADRATE